MEGDGLRTLSGGQFTIQVDGALAAQLDVAPPLVVDATHAVRDVFAILRQPATGGDIRLRVKQDGTDYCELTIPEGSPVSNVVDGFGLPPLQMERQLTLEIVEVPQSNVSSAGGDLFPGADLTLSIRM